MMLMLRAAQTSRLLIRRAGTLAPRALFTSDSDPPTISRFASPATADHLPAHLQDRLAEVSDKAGFTPNIFKALWRRPAELEAFWDYHDAVMEETDELSKADREAIVVATSGENRCHYCCVAHGAISRVYSKKPHLSDQLANNYRKADISDRERAMLDFAVKVSQEAQAIGDDDFAKLAAAGFSDEAAWDIASVASFFAMSNRLANVMALRPNDEFYQMGREPRKQKQQEEPAAGEDAAPPKGKGDDGGESPDVIHL